VSAVIAEGKCEFCKRGQFSLCNETNPSSKMREMLGGDVTAGLFGYSHLTGGYWGGQAQYARVPMADINTLCIPNSLSDQQALLLSDVLPTGTAKLFVLNPLAK
jgi:threonine dehydrogenase-like Zn-dependent dehydrogenase